uniref:Uncharacterized protein n=1 Tax=Cacopsylla melanoneura TaxID=428564 RepID=A0A8D9EDC2_9HEMI
MSDSIKMRKARSVQPPCAESCKFRCFEKITKERRQAIFREFWDLGNLEDQRFFIAINLDQVIPTYRYSKSKRAFNHAYHLTNTVGEKERVCREFFRNTLDISTKMIHNVKRRMANPEFTFEDFRGKYLRQ